MGLDLRYCWHELPKWRMQFSLGTLFGITAVASCVLAWVARERVLLTREHRAITLLESTYNAYALSLPGRYGEPDARPYFDPSELLHGRAYRPIVTVFIPSTSLDRAAWHALHSFRYLEWLHFQDCQLNTADETAFSALQSLKDLDIIRTPLALHDIRGIAKLSKLESLTLDGTFGSAIESLENIGQLKSLTSLAIENVDISEDSFARIAELKELRSLHLRGCRISCQSAKCLARLSKLEHLNLSSSEIYDDALSSFVELPQLQSLTLDKTNVTDDGMPAIASCRNLQNLSLRDTALTEGGIRILGKLPRLKALDVSGTRVTNPSSQGVRPAQ